MFASLRNLCVFAPLRETITYYATRRRKVLMWSSKWLDGLNCESNIYFAEPSPRVGLYFFWVHKSHFIDELAKSFQMFTNQKTNQIVVTYQTIASVSRSWSGVAALRVNNSSAYRLLMWHSQRMRIAFYEGSVSQEHRAFFRFVRRRNLWFNNGSHPAGWGHCFENSCG